MKQWLLTGVLFVAFLLLGYGLVQQTFLKHNRMISFACVVALQNSISEFCVRADERAIVEMTVTWCDGAHLMSGSLTKREDGSYRWMWLNAPGNCVGKASASARASWPDGSIAETTTSFLVPVDISSPSVRANQFWKLAHILLRSQVAQGLFLERGEAALQFL